MGPSAGLDRCGKSRTHRNSIAGPSIPQSVAIPTELPGPPLIHVDSKNMADTIRYVKINYRVHNSLTTDPVESIPRLNTSFLAIHFNSNLPPIVLRVPLHSFFRFPG
jgi:hypothetical protein